jgi:hypothetical protein
VVATLGRDLPAARKHPHAADLVVIREHLSHASLSVADR